MYSRNDLQIVASFVDLVRANPAMYAPGGGTAYGLAYLLGTDALLLGAQSTRTYAIGQWLLVSADIDWLSPPYQLDFAPSELFRKKVPCSALGPTAHRSEIVVAALAQSGLIADAKDHARVFGDVDAPREVLEACCPAGFVQTVAFTPNGSNFRRSGPW